MTTIHYAPTPLRAAREATGYSLVEAAELAGLDVSHLSKIERGLIHPSIPTLRRIARVCGLFELVALLEPLDHSLRPEPAAEHAQPVP